MFGKYHKIFTFTTELLESKETVAIDFLATVSSIMTSHRNGFREIPNAAICFR